MVTRTPLCNLPTGGGWGFRFFPLAMVNATIDRLNDDGYPAVLFLHPREMDPNGPRLELSPFRKFVAYGGKNDAVARLRQVLARYRFGTLGQLADTWQPV
jgi:hypothetical protein